MGTIQIKRGLSQNLPTSAVVAEILYTTDTKRFYIGNGSDSELTEFASFKDILEALNLKSEKEHTHVTLEITDFDNSVDTRIAAQKGAVNGIASLDQNGLIPISQVPSVFKEAEVVANIEARNSLQVFSGLHAFVLDATADSTVESGGAEYIYAGEKWVKISELNNLDTVITWENITNKPDLKTNLLELTDTPDSFANNAGKILAVNDSEDGIEFKSVYAGDVDGGSF